MKDRLYAVMNLRILKENIAAYASYAPNMPYEKVDEVQNKIDELIKTIEDDH